ncbi:MAG: bifunctional adenosylcobinamide kinase/adenosylcobinamide-phosphate guanylyltransferase [Oscillospiraceae bacterium]|nr:bifunctional adenosylcobinamide kinase/adenosylcobinamide-phosphate guanylyltransferase [Oscillospiraceae bacterium]
MLILLTGGAACGKSAFAEKLTEKLPGPKYYIAAMEPFGEESLKKIARHREMRRARGFETIERYTDAAGLELPARGCALLECLCNLTANEMFSPDGAGPEAENAVIRGLEALKRQCDTLIVVTNEVGSGYDTYGDRTPEYIETLGRINRRAAAMADAVAELVCGLPIMLKGELP